MSEARAKLNEIVRRWEEEGRADPRDIYPYRNLLDELLFHADLRFKDYIQFQHEGEFPVRLLKWLDNFENDNQRQALFKLLRWMIFVDHLQILSLQRDAFRRIVVPWLFDKEFGLELQLNSNFEKRTTDELRKYALFSITESFVFPDFIHINDLAGTAKPTVLGEKLDMVEAIIQPSLTSFEGAIVFEDFVGTGKQAGRIVAELRRCSGSDWRILFIPLIVLEKGLENLNKKLGSSGVTVEPALTIPSSSSLQKEPRADEPLEFKRVRTLIKQNAKRVLERLDSNDDPPKDPFGFGNSGALLITCNNSPNNTLPVFHHKAPRWEALFRRVHHSKDHL